MPDEVKLLPCPFCGAKGNLFDSWQTKWRVKCSNYACHAEVRMVNNKAEAIAAWNTRAIEATRPTDMEVRDARQEAAQSFGGQEGDLHFELAKVLTIHWLTGLGCSHEGAGSNAALCWCGWTGPRVENVGQAVTCWVNHTLEEMRPQLVAAFERQGNG